MDKSQIQTTKNLGDTFEPQSWLSAMLGLDKHPAILKDINAVGATVLTGIATESPVAGALINVLEKVGTPPLTPITAISTVGTIVTVIDPKFITKVETAIESKLAELGVSPEIIKALHVVEVAEFQALGFSSAA